MSKTLNHFTTSDFWENYHSLPLTIQKVADKQYQLLKENPNHPSLNLKKIGDLWSVRVTKNYRALDQYYQQTQADDIGALLGSLQLLSDGIPADPAMWDDWLIAVEKVLPSFSEKEKTLIL
jgi:hypothetical protein